MIIKLAEIVGFELVARSQAKRLTKLIKADDVILDFDGVIEIGQAFADELFRVFASEHPTVNLSTVNTSADVRKMISRARFKKK